MLRARSPSLVLPSPWRLLRRVRARAPLPYLVCVCLRAWAYHSCSFCALGSAVCVFGGGGVLSGGVWLPSLGFAGVPFIPSLLSARAAHKVLPHTILIPFRGVGGLVLHVFFGGVHIFFGGGGPLLFCVNARACTSLPTCQNLDQSFFFLLILPTITNSTRGWPLLGLPTLPTAGE